MNSTVAAVRRPCFAPATLCRMSELRRLVPIAADDTTINDGTTMAATTTITTTSTHHVAPIREFVPGHLTGTTSVAQVCRNLFGPIDHEENIRFVQQELHKISSDDMLKWNYDFKTDKPLEGKYAWEATHAAQVPDAYHALQLQASAADGSALKCLPAATSSSRSKASTQSHSKKSRALKMPSSSVKARRTLSFSSDQEGQVAAPSCGSDCRSRDARLSKEDSEKDHDNCSAASCAVLDRVTEDSSSNKEDAINDKSAANSSQNSNELSSAITAASREQQPTTKAGSKQTSMTDFLKHRKRTLSTSDDASTSSTGQPALKKIRPEQE